MIHCHKTFWVYLFHHLCFCQSVRTVNFALPFTASVTVSISTNFPFLASNIPSSPVYGVFISQPIRYVRAFSCYDCFIRRAMRLSNKLLGQGYVKERLKSSLRNLCSRYLDLIKQYEASSPTFWMITIYRNALH